MIEPSCHCGAVRLEMQSAPEEVNNCNCSICRRYGASWAYYSPADVRLIAKKGATDCYLWGEKTIEFHHCRNCGRVTHWAAVDRQADRMRVNARRCTRRS
jgi:hypothetical protein